MRVIFHLNRFLSIFVAVQDIIGFITEDPPGGVKSNFEWIAASVILSTAKPLAKIRYIFELIVIDSHTNTLEDLTAEIKFEQRFTVVFIEATSHLVDNVRVHRLYMIQVESLISGVYSYGLLNVGVSLSS